MVADRSSNRTVLPITDLSPFNELLQNRCVSTAAPAAFGPSSSGPSRRPSDRLQAHDLEVRAVDDAGPHDAWLAEADHREANLGELAEVGERGDPGPQVLDLRDREHDAVAAQALGALADVDQPILVAVDERPQQHTPDDAENRGVGADAQGQGDDHRDDQPLALASDRKA